MPSSASLGVQLLFVGAGRLVFFGADFEVGEEPGEQGGVLVFDLEMGTLLASFDQSDGDQLLQVRGEIGIADGKDHAQLGGGDLVFLHEMEKAQAGGVGEGGEEGEQGGHVGAILRRVESLAASEMVKVTKSSP
jgi:hypothetical protein